MTMSDVKAEWEAKPEYRRFSQEELQKLSNSVINYVSDNGERYNTDYSAFTDENRVYEKNMWNLVYVISHLLYQNHELHCANSAVYKTTLEWRAERLTEITKACLHYQKRVYEILELVGYE